CPYNRIASRCAAGRCSVISRSKLWRSTVGVLAGPEAVWAAKSDETDAEMLNGDGMNSADGHNKRHILQFDHLTCGRIIRTNEVIPLLAGVVAWPLWNIRLAGRGAFGV